MEQELVPLYPPFEVAVRGFDRQQVIDHIESLQGHITMVEADRDAALQHMSELHKMLDHLRSEGTALEHLRRESEQVTAQLQRLEHSPTAGASVRIQQMLQLAEDEAAELRTDAQQEAAALRSRARDEAERLEQETIQRCERLEAEAVARIDDYETRSVGRLQLMLQVIGERLRRRMAEVEHEVSELDEVRRDVERQLGLVHSLLAEALGSFHRAVDAAPASRDPLPLPRQPTAADADRAGGQIAFPVSFDGVERTAGPTSA